jgi:hypothetical protein
LHEWASLATNGLALRWQRVGQCCCTVNDGVLKDRWTLNRSGLKGRFAWAWDRFKYVETHVARVLSIYDSTV